VPESASPYRGHRFPGEVIARAVRLYPRFAPSFGDVEELPADRGVTASHQTVPRRAARFWASYAEERRRREVRAGPTWHLDETATRVGGQRQWLRRAVDEHGQTLDVLLQAQRTRQRPNRSSDACSTPQAARRRPGTRPAS
jgi:putative transposase